MVHCWAPQIFFTMIEFMPHAIDTDIKAKRNKMISDLIALRIAKAKGKVKFGVKYLREHECERSSVQLVLKAKAKKQICGKSISLYFPCQLQRFARVKSVETGLLGQVWQARDDQGALLGTNLSGEHERPIEQSCFADVC